MMMELSMLQEASRASSGAQARSFTCSQQKCCDCTHVLQGLVRGRGQGMRLQGKASTWQRHRFRFVS